MKQSENRKSYYIFSIIGMIGVLLIGGVIGFALNNSSNNSIHSTMTKKDCDKITEQIINAGYNNKTELIEELNEVYSENCKNRIFEEPKPVEKPKPEEKKLPETTCGKIEMLLLEQLQPVEYPDFYAHIENSKIYENLSERGCPENSEKFKELAKQELEIANALDTNNEFKKVDARTCEKIELELSNQLNCVHGFCSENNYINDAKIYANLSERGCPENSEKFKELAKQQLEIARALTDDKMENEFEATEIVETYKRLKMQAEAERMIEKAKKLTNPAIDFIIQLEKIIEE